MVQDPPPRLRPLTSVGAADEARVLIRALRVRLGGVEGRIAGLPADRAQRIVEALSEISRAAERVTGMCQQGEAPLVSLGQGDYAHVPGYARGGGAC